MPEGVWAALHDFGGTLGIKGDPRRISRVPCDAMPPTARATTWGMPPPPPGRGGDVP